ncbi:penicillin-binding transpeptidase domain-containing protein [Chitinophagaceae bacterium MMS25-I14]
MKKDIRFRVYVAFTCICVFGVAILVKAAMIQVKEGKELRSLSNQMHMHTDTLYAERGNIYSEDGLLLCSSIPQFDAYVDFTVIQRDTFRKYRDTLSVCLSRLLGGGTPAEYKQRIEAAYADSVRYFPLKKNMQYYDYQTLRAFPVFNKGSRRGGLIVESKVKRVNPYGMLAFRTIGLWRPSIWKDGVQKKNILGLEAAYDSVLSGANGSRVMEKETGGVWVPVDGTEIDPQNGKDIVTTLDFSIQDVAEHALKSVVEKYECLNGTCVVMEVQTGKIRAMVNLGRDSATGNYYEDQNYALTRAEPGSTFKMATLISLLNDGYINVNDMVNCEGGQKQFANRVMHDSHHGLGVMPIKNAYAQSSNVGMASLAYKFYYKDPEKYVEHLRKLHLMDRTGIDISGELKPRMITPGSRDWNATTLPWMATGYGVMITPLHTCMLYNAVANNGRMMKPYLVDAIREYGKNIKTFQPVVLEEKIADSNAIAQLHLCTEEVVLSGTGHHIQSPNYKIAGKTGTAQVVDKIGGRMYRYSDGVYQGSFVGYFPADRPRYTMVVVIRTKPHSGAYYGGTIAAPVFRMIADKIFANGVGGNWMGPLDSFARINDQLIAAKAATAKNYQILLNAMGRQAEAATPARSLAQLSVDSNKRMTIQKRLVLHGQVPDVKGMGLKDAVYLLENEGMRVQVQGNGTVLAQSLAAGTPVVKGQVIQIQLGSVVQAQAKTATPKTTQQAKG